eukprot:CAMPEP_0184707844 /NCGR_PEP_ID=MMETSP0313-20130426/37474_1 /TAXON_ID=2792 /ORGANISM="Porphyridium aerugineum, Strain SAG 1380-2" /LENGTH=211 /DNA_ID=CAMNT_0027169425 /DNA_START=517 /DNA_END=1152 /DNA_ORIENTATION=+
MNSESVSSYDVVDRDACPPTAFVSDDYLLDLRDNEDEDGDNQESLQDSLETLAKPQYADEKEVRSLGARCVMALSSELEEIKIENQRTKSPRVQSTNDLSGLVKTKVRRESGTAADFEKSNANRQQRVQAYLAVEELEENKQREKAFSAPMTPVSVSSRSSSDPSGASVSPRRESFLDRMFHPLKVTSPKARSKPFGSKAMARGTFRNLSK